jgi:hypothetical protein
MSITGHLAQVRPELLDELRRDPQRAQALVFSLAMPTLAGPSDPEALAGLLDDALRGIGPMGCGWALLPRFFRHWLLRRFLPRAPQAPAAPEAGHPEDARAEILAAQRELQRAIREAQAHSPDPAEPPPEGRTKPNEDRANPSEHGPDPDPDPEDFDDEDRDDEDHGDDPDDFDGDLGEPSPEERAKALADTQRAHADVLGHLDLHKHWHILHFALTGSVEEVPGPAGDALLGGEELGEDLGYGPLRVLSVERVQAVAAHLAEVGVQGIVSGIRTRRVPDEVYGADFAREWEELRYRARALCRFYEEAAREAGRASLHGVASRVT